MSGSDDRIRAAWIPEELDPEADQIRQVYAKYGVAMYYAQVLEHGLANFIVASRAGETGIDPQRLWDELFAMTMGQQMRQALMEAELSNTLIDRLKRALRIRNVLAHHYFRERAEQMLSVHGRISMLDELEDMRAELEATDNALEPITHRLLEAKGVSRAMLEAELARMHAEHGD